MDPLTDNILPALPLGVLLSLLWLIVFRRKSREFGGFVLPLWQLLLLLGIGNFLLSFTAGDETRPAVALIGSSFVGLLLSAWILSRKEFTIGRKKKASQRRGRGRLKSSRSFRIQPASLAPLLPLLTLAGLAAALMIALEKQPGGKAIANQEPSSEAIPPVSLPDPEVTEPPAVPAAEAAGIAAADATSPATAAETMVAADPPKPTTPTTPTSLQPDEQPAATDVGASTAMAPPEKEMPEEKATSPVSQAISFAPKTVSFRKHVLPILKQNCFDCHNAEKQKGDLRLDTPDFIRKGGKNGPIIVAGVSDRSRFYTMTTLDADDPDVMPTKGKLLTKAEQGILRIWIEEGADLEDGKPFGTRSSMATKMPRVKLAAPTGEATPIEPKTLATLQRRFVVLRPLNNEHTLFEAVLRATDPDYPTPELKLLEPIATNIHTLDLARTEISDADLAILARCSNLAVLRLAGTPIGDAAMEHLKDLRKLNSLNLTRTKVTDAGLIHLEGIATLSEIFAAGTAITGAGADRLTSATGATVKGVF